ncbi:hypothetical protein K438DRAFT_1745042 [Mycena galopus ATCC 62051]|nr:hypothetical protein K438DRAFT_1745042 [Mycena galopus ATCC 62051]
MAFSFSFTLPEPLPAPDYLTNFLDVSPGSMGYDLIISHIDELESQVAVIDEAIASLQLHRADLLKSVQTHKAIIAPVRRLPPEILGEIFALVMYATFHFGDISQVIPR